LPFWRTSDIFNVSSAAVCQSAFFHEVVRVTVWTFDIKTSCGHIDVVRRDSTPEYERTRVQF
jgi:hypothetical protein